MIEYSNNIDKWLVARLKAWYLLQQVHKLADGVVRGSVFRRGQLRRLPFHRYLRGRGQEKSWTLYKK
jgi:hypothetical protein